METINFCRAENLLLSHHHGEVVTPAPLSFYFPKGKKVALIGPNGSGKTTLLRAMIGEPVVASGSLVLEPFTKSMNRVDPATLARHIAIVTQDSYYPSHLCVEDCLRLAYLPRVGLFGAIPPASTLAIKEISERMGLSRLSRRNLGELSTGERQRVFLARALLQRPKVLLLDEPTNHLDPGGIRSFWQALEAARHEGDFELVVSTHEIAFVKEKADWICALKAGRLFYNGPADVFWEPEASRFESLFYC